LRIVYLRTRVGKELGLEEDHVGLDSLKHLFDHSEESLLLLLDILSDRLDSIRKNIKEHERRLIVFKIDSNGYMRLLKPLIHNPYRRVFGDKSIIGLYIPQGYNGGFPPDQINHVERIKPDHRTLYLLIINRLPLKIIHLLLLFERFIKFSLVGFTGYFVNLLTLYLAAHILIPLIGREYAIPLSSIISFESSITWNFILHEHWTFKDLGLPRSRLKMLLRWLKYHVASLGSLLAQFTFVTILSGFMNYPLYLSLTLGVLAGLALNYTISKTFAWRK
jgi:dolichol-phosphate mannosyltransferase